MQIIGKVGAVAGVGAVDSVTDTPAQQVAAASPAVAAKAAPPAARLLNPQPVLDPGLGIVVTEYFNQAGKMTSQYRTEHVLDSYRTYGLHRDQTDADDPAGEGD